MGGSGGGLRGSGDTRLVIRCVSSAAEYDLYSNVPCASHILSPLPRLVPATGIFSLPFRDQCPRRVYSLSHSVIGARYGQHSGTFGRAVLTEGCGALTGVVVRALFVSLRLRPRGKAGVGVLRGA
eukprot:4899288-Pyramimonas_sp.AAC.2